MSGNLKLVVSNENPQAKIIASIRPLGRDVAPSPQFRVTMRGRLLKLSPSARASQAA